MNQKRFVFLLVLLSMVMLMAVPAMALEGKGTQASPYQVDSLEELEEALTAEGTGRIYIQLTGSIELKNEFTFQNVGTRDFTIDGLYNGQYYGFNTNGIASSAEWPLENPSKPLMGSKHLINLRTGNRAAIFKNLVFDSGNKAAGVDVVEASNVTLDNVTIRSNSKAKVSLTVNNSNVTAITNLKISGCIIAVDTDKAGTFTVLDDGNITGVVRHGNGVNTLYAGWYSKNPNDAYIPEGYRKVVEGTGWRVEPITYTVRFVTNGGPALADLHMKYGQPIVLPQVPVRHGFTFDGWYLDANCTTPFQPGTVPTADMVIYLGWVRVPATGDSTPLALYAALMTLAAAAWVGLRRRSA